MGAPSHERVTATLPCLAPAWTSASLLPMLRLVVGFDLDMTLVDSRPGIATTLHALSAETGVAIDADVVVNRLGPALEVEMAEWFPADRVADVSDRYRELYSELGVPGTFVLPGAFEAVAGGPPGRRPHDRGHREVRAQRAPCLAHVGLEVDVVVGWRHGPGKAEALVEHGAAVYVGDTPPDMAAARGPRARVAVGVTTGPHDTRTPCSRCRRRRRAVVAQAVSGVVPTPGGATAAAAALQPPSVEHHDDRQQQETDGRGPEEDPVVVAHRRRRVERPRGPRGRRHRDELGARQLRVQPQRERLAHLGEQLLVDGVHVDVLRGQRLDQLLIRQHPGRQILQIDRSRDRVVGRQQLRLTRHTRTSRSGPPGPLSSSTMPCTCPTFVNGFDRSNVADPSGRRAHAPTVHPAADRSANRTRCSNFPPFASAAATASASSTTCTPTRRPTRRHAHPPKPSHPPCSQQAAHKATRREEPSPGTEAAEATGHGPGAERPLAHRRVCWRR